MASFRDFLPKRVETTNVVLKKQIEDMFKPLGIIGYSNCCRLGCTQSYDEDYDGKFVLRPHGIIYFKLFLSGMNFDPSPTIVYIEHRGVEYLNAHWDEELALITKWCELLGRAPGEYEVVRPATSNQAIVVKFAKALHFESEKEDD
jgi:hypothetical protein